VEIYANQILYIDLHDWTSIQEDAKLKKRYRFTFIDDRTRMIVDLQILNGKTSKSASRALKNTLNFRPTPSMIISDNVGKFTGKNSSMLLLLLKSACTSNAHILPKKLEV
jgi:hypothetical protein